MDVYTSQVRKLSFPRELYFHTKNNHPTWELLLLESLLIIFSFVIFSLAHWGPRKGNQENNILFDHILPITRVIFFNLKHSEIFVFPFLSSSTSCLFWLFMYEFFPGN